MARQINRPNLGRPADSRLTREVIDSDPRLAGVEPFDPAQDVDIVDEINNALVGVALDIEEAGGGGGVESLDDLSDVDLSGGVSGQVLTLTGGVWKPGTPATGGGGGGGDFAGYAYGFGRGGDVEVGPGLPAPFDSWNAGTNTLTLGNDVSVRNLTVPADITLRTNGWRVFVSGTLTVDGIIGNDGVDTIEGDAPQGTNWGSLGRGGGTQNVFYAMGGEGAGGWAVNRPEPGYADGAGSADVGFQILEMSFNTWYQGSPTRYALNGGSAGGGGGQTTLNGAVAANGNGGGGGGVALISARTITGFGLISARGGRGGNGVVSGTTPTALQATGGGGGGGGFLRVITASDATPVLNGAAMIGDVTLSAEGGAGGSGDNGGQDGVPGGVGTLEIIILK